MPIYIKENNALKDNMYEIPPKLQRHLQDTLTKFQDYSQDKGYKRLNSLVNPDYNKRSDKEDRLHSDAKHISFSDLKRIDHDFRHMNQNPHDFQRQMNGGDEMARFARETLNKERTKVEPVLKQEKVKSLAKSNLKPTLSEPSSITVGNITAQVHESKKKIYIQENQINTLYEYRSQLTIPFEGEGKYNYEHFLDYLEDNGMYGTLPPTSNPNLSDFVDKQLGQGFELFKEDDDLYDAFLVAFPKFLDTYADELDDLFTIPYYQEYMEDEDGYSDLMLHYLNNYGQHLWSEYLYDIYTDNFHESNFPHEVKQDERGLIYIERVITLPPSLSKTFSTYRGELDDFYKFLEINFKGCVGTYWSWGHGDSYCGCSYTNEQDVTLKGYVDPKHVNWEQTLYKQTYPLAHEQEITIQDGAPIEIVEINLGNKKKLPLNGSIIVKA